MESLPALLLFTFSASITPGPNNVMILTSGLNYGIRRSMPHLLGIVLGFSFMVLVIGFGFGLLFARFPLLHTVIKIAGVIYLLFLAWRVWTTSPREIEGTNKPPLNFLQAALFQWLNPKAWMMATSGIATFASAEASTVQIMLIAAVFMIASFTCTGSWLVFGAALKKLLSQPGPRSIFNRVMAALLVLSLLPTLQELATTFGLGTSN
ncbi:MAG: LysE family translocator [Pseudomonadota bacterium]